MAIILVDPSDDVLISLDWTDALPTGVSLSSVSHSVSSPLSISSEYLSVEDNLSSAKVSGAAHGGTYMLQATATLDNGEVINRAATLRCVDA